MFWLTIFSLVGTIWCAKILTILPTVSKSHSLIGLKLANELAKKGHHVTCISYYKNKDQHENLTELVMDSDVNLSDFMSRLLLPREFPVMYQMSGGLQLNLDLARNFFTSPQFQSVKKQKFDLVIYEVFTAHIYTALGYHFNCPVIALNTLQSNIYNNFALGNYLDPSYVPFIGSDFTSDMTFWQRLKNMYYNYYGHLKIYWTLQQENEIWQEFFGPAPNLNTLIYNISLMLTYSHPAINEIIPLVPAIKEVGGFHLEKPKLLPKDLREFLDSAQNGAILVSMGSILQSSLMPEEKKLAFIKTFEKTKLKILWKYEDNLIINNNNLKISKWLPQLDVLAHPNLKAFISHCGAFSTIEAIHFGVPLICLPVYWDQHKNANFALKNGFGIKIPFQDLTESALSEAINKIVTPSYKIKAEKQSRLFRDNPIKPLDEAVYWVEYVIRYKGAPHLRSPALNYHWYQNICFNIVLLLLIIFLVLKQAKKYLYRKMTVFSEKKNK